MVRSHTWTIEIHISEHDEGGAVRSAEGVHGDGEDLAVARMLAELTDKLLELTHDDVEQVTHGPGRLLI